ncbi:MAG: GIY-YIG nuclease family protein [Oscillospiraceae bacterium]|nr:GIY-YIG nuclease family protein [Oscillospiraceae bacterium]
MESNNTNHYGLPSPPAEAHYTVYCLIDPDGKKYVGCTGKSVKERWGNGWNYNASSQIAKAIRAIGWENFEKKILCEKLTREGAEKLEKWFIAYYDSANPEKGYNRALGGLVRGFRLSEASKEACSRSIRSLYEEDPGYRERVSRGIKDAYDRDPSYREKISRTAKENWQDPVYREKVVSGTRKAYENTELASIMSSKGKKYYEKHPERREEISRQMKEYTSKPENRQFADSPKKPKPVICVEMETVFPSRRAAERATGYAGVHKACSGIQATCGGYHWRYL